MVAEFVVCVMMVRHSVPCKGLKRVEEVFWDQIYGEPIRGWH